MRTPPVIGIVGGIGSGKSAVADILRAAGCIVSDSDSLAHSALSDPEVRAAMVSWWGTNVLRSDGTIDRRAVGRIVFADANERRRLESLIHPWIARERDRTFAAAPPETPACVIDAPLLLEAGLGSVCDAVVFVDAPRELRLARVRSTRGWDEAELSRREAAQWPIGRKRAAAQHVVSNVGDREALESRVREMLATIMSETPRLDR